MRISSSRVLAKCKCGRMLRRAHTVKATDKVVGAVLTRTRTLRCPSCHCYFKVAHSYQLAKKPKLGCEFPGSLITREAPWRR